MLSEEYITNLIQPIVDRQESINMYIITKIANRLRDVSTMRPSDLYKLQMLFQSGADVREINIELARQANLQVRDIKRIIKIAAQDMYIDAKPFYDYRHKSYIPFEKNDGVQRIVSIIGEQTEQSYRNLADSRAIGYVTEDPRSGRRIRFTSINNAYQDAIDKAIQAVQLGVVDPEVAIRNTIKNLVNSGLRRLYWESGRTQRLDTAVRRNVLQGVRTLNIELEKELGKQFGADGIELSAHANSAPDHEPFQGHIFTNEQFENLQSGNDFVDVKGRHFTGVERAIGMWNCYHFITSIVIGAKKPTYSDKRLQKFIDDNHRGITLDGKHMTMYECKQMQRRLETRIRYAKENQMAMRTLGDTLQTTLARNRVKHLSNEYVNFSKRCGLSPQTNRTFVHNYHA